MSCLPEKQPNEHIEALVKRHTSDIILEIQASTISAPTNENLVLNKATSSKSSLASLSPAKSTKTLSPKKELGVQKPSLARKSLKDVSFSSQRIIKSARQSVDKKPLVTKSRDTSLLKKPCRDSLTSTSVSNDFKIDVLEPEPKTVDIKVLGFRTQVFSGLNYQIRIEVESKIFVASIWEKSRPGNSQLTGVTAF